MSIPGRRGVQAEYARIAGDYDRRWAAYTAATSAATLRPLSLGPNDRLLDVGCGTGVLLEQVRARWPSAHTMGVDLSRGMLARARRRLEPGVPLVQAEAGALPFAAGAFAVVVSNSSLHFWPDRRGALREIARVLRPGGRLVITDWSGDFAALRLFGVWLGATGRGTQRPLCPAELRTLLQETGFGVADVRRWKQNWFWGLMTVDATRNTD